MSQIRLDEFDRFFDSLESCEVNTAPDPMLRALVVPLLPPEAFWSDSGVRVVWALCEAGNVSL
jgi:hypothetical protein